MFKRMTTFNCHI